MDNIITQYVYTIGRIEEKGIKMLGTGFMIPGGKHIVTTRHAIGDCDDRLVIILPTIANFNDYQDTTTNQVSYANVHIKFNDPFRDISILELESSVEDARFPRIEIGSIDEINVGEEIYVFGFPHCVEGRRVLTMQTAKVGAKILVDSSGIKSKHCVINTQTRPGQSGSMIYSEKTNKIVGILIGAFVPFEGISLGGINPRELHQTTQCLSAEYIKNMIGA